MLDEWNQGRGDRETMTLEEFTTAMKELFLYQYHHLVASCSFNQLFAQTMVENLEHPLLWGETKELQPLRSLRNAPQHEAERLVAFVMEKLESRIRREIAGLFRAAARYERQEEQQNTGKFQDMVLGASETFDLGPEGLFGLPGSDAEASVAREHSSAETFTAFNNDVARETSPAQELNKALPDGWGGKVHSWDYRGQVDLCADCNHDFMQHPMVVKAGLSKVEVVVARMYTGPMYKKYNGVLRSFLPKMEEYMAQHNLAPSTSSLLEASKYARAQLGTEYATTIHVLASAIQKLRRENPLPDNLKVYRGFAGLALPPRFLVRDRKGNRGGVEFAFMSTSTDKQQALGYIRFDKGMPRLFEMEVGHIDRGADLSWLSYFPAEAEVLMPPLSGVEVKGEPHYENIEASVQVPGPDGQATGRREQRVVQVWRIGLNVNVKGKTMEEHQGARKQLFLKAAEEGMDQVDKDVRGFKSTREFEACATRDVFLMRETEEKQTTIKGFEDSVLREWQEELARWDAMPAADFNRPEAFQRVYSRLLEMLRLVQLKKRVWLRNPEQGLPNISGITLKEALRTGLARNRVLLNAANTSAHDRATAASEQLQFRGVVSSDVEEVVDGESQLHRACAEGTLDVVSLLLTAHADCNRRSASDETPLILAARGGSDDICGLLLAASVDIDAVENRVGGSAVYWAAAEGYPQTVELLIGQRADVNLATHCLSTPLGIAAYFGHLACVLPLIRAGANVDARKNTGSAPLFLACQNGHADVAQALIEARCDVNLATDGGATPLYMAASDNHLAAMERLLAAECDVDMATDDGSTPVCAAARNDHIRALEMLVAARCDVNKLAHDGSSAVYVAARHNHIGAVERLIAAKCDVSLATKDGFSPVFIAAQENHLEVMQLLIAANCDVDRAGLSGTTPLLVAYAKGNTEAMSRLLAAKCDVDKTLDDGCTALFVAARDNNSAAVEMLLAASCDVDKPEQHGMSPLVVASQNDSLDAVDRLIEAKCDVNKPTHAGATPLYVAAEHNRVGALDRLVAASCDVDKARDDGASPLHSASLNNHTQAIERLLAANCNVDTANQLGFTPLSCAAQNGHKEATDLLIAGKCDVDKAEAHGATPLFVASQKNALEVIDLLLAAKCNVDKAKEGNATPLLVAALNNHADAIDRLVAAGCDVNKALDAGASPLFIAAQENRVEAVGRLIAAGCDLDLPMKDGKTPVYIAAVKNQTRVVDLLVEAKCDVDKATNEGFTPLFIACQEDRVEALDRLIAAKCDVNKPSNKALTPLVMAAFKGSVQVAKKLVAAGADRARLATADATTALQIARKYVKDTETLAALELVLKFEMWEVHGSTLLHRAAAENQAHDVRRLVEERCDANVSNAHGCTALHLAASSNSAEAAAALAGAGCDMETRDRLERTALDRAAVEGHAEVAAALVAANADPRACGRAGRSALVLAAMAGQHSVLRRLTDDAVGADDSWHWSDACSLGAAAVLLIRGDAFGVQIDPAARSVHFSRFGTVGFCRGCPVGRRAWYEVTIVEALRDPQIGFATRRFMPSLGNSSDGVGDDDASWGVDGIRGKRWSAGGSQDWAAAWKEGDVVGFACDLEAQSISVSVNGDFSPPNGAVFDLRAASPGELFAVLSAGGGRVEYNFGEDGRAMRYAGPTAEYVPMAT